ncbi:MAG: capsule assembly Wzi family protein [Gemmatimonadaceae bacterium]
MTYYRPAVPVIPTPRIGRIAAFRACLLMVAGFAVLAPIPSHAQSSGGHGEVFVGSEFESYLRYLQTTGKSRHTIWSIRGLSPGQLDALAPSDTLHPWARRYDFSRPARTGVVIGWVRPTVGFIANTAYPWGSNDGAIWAGKGLTAWAQAGFTARLGPISATFAPVAFRASNSEFDLMDNGQIGDLKFADGQFPLEIDKPQRFGDGAYSRFDFGESTLRIDLAGVGAGISSASQWWGPTIDYPYILGNNAGGFPHMFVGTSKPANVGFGTMHGRLVYGQLLQSRYSPVTGRDYFESYLKPGRVRFMAGAVGTMTIRGISGLEIGGSRFFHSAIDSTGFKASDLKLPWQNLLKNRLAAEGDTVFGDDRSLLQNQLASIFFRWAPAASGIEIYGEYGREDFSADIRDFMLQPDHSATINLGFRKAWLKGTRMNAVRTEVFNYTATASGRTRGEGLIYLHQPLQQGHTYRGQLLGANVGAGSGSAQLIAVERFTTGGRMKGFFSRVTQGEISLRLPPYTTGERLENPTDVQYSLGGELSRFVGPFDVTGRAVLTSQANRYFLEDKGNLNVGLTIRQGF